MDGALVMVETKKRRFNPFYVVYTGLYLAHPTSTMLQN